MKNIIRVIGSCIASFVAVFVLLVLVEGFSAIVHPTPAGFTGTMEEMCDHVANYPAWVLALVVPMWGFIAFIGTWLAGRLGGRISAILIAVLLLAGAACNISMLPYASWFKLVQPLAILAGIAYAFYLLNRPARSTLTPATA